MSDSSFLESRLALLNERYVEALRKGQYFYHPIHEDADAATPIINGRRTLQFSSYSYLGLAEHPAIKAAATAAISEFGTGSHGVRLLAGTTPFHEKLERRIAAFKGAEDAVVYSSGYVANIAAITTLVGRGHTVISDRLNHASIIDGCILSGAHHLRYDHADTDSLERCLKQAGPVGCLVVIDAVFSMDGDITNLPEISRLCRQYGAALMVDEAHSIGVLGETGRGVEEHFGLGGDTVDVKMGTLSKAIPAVGGYIAGSKQLTDALRHNSRPYIFSAALPPAMAAAALRSLDVIENEPGRLIKLRGNITTYREGLGRLGFEVLGDPSVAIVPIICSTEEKTVEMTRGCIERGLLILPIVFPAVPQKTPRLRTIVTAGHSPENISQALSILADVGRSVGLLA